MNRYSCALVARVLATISIVAACAAPVAATEKPSFDIESMLQMAWETQWTEQGMPMNATRWTMPIRVRYIGDRANILKKDTENFFKRFIDITGATFEEVAQDDPSANFTFDLKAKDPKVTETVSCYTQSNVNDAGFAQVVVVIVEQNARGCTAHELGHAFGMWGHPLSKSVMTYFGAGRVLTELDAFFLKGLYSESVRHNDTPFLFLEKLSTRYIDQLSNQADKKTATEKSAAFILERKIEMDEFAMNNGHAPSIIYRSGRVMPAMVELARNAMAVILARHHLLSNPKPDDFAYALRYLNTAAERGWPQAMWFLMNGYGGQVVPGTSAKLRPNDRLFHLWASCLIASGVTQHKPWFDAFEAKLKPEQFEGITASTKTFFDEGKCKVPPKS